MGKQKSKGDLKKKDPRIMSGDPRLKGLESIYLNKFGGSASQKNLNKQKPPVRKPYLNNFNNRAEDF